MGTAAQKKPRKSLFERRSEKKPTPQQYAELEKDVLLSNQKMHLQSCIMRGLSAEQADEINSMLAKGDEARQILGSRRTTEMGRTVSRLHAMLRDRIWSYYNSRAMTEASKQVMRNLVKYLPNYIYRIASDITGTSRGKRSTNGYDAVMLHLPQAHVCEDTECADSAEDEPNIIEMLGRRFLWDDRNADATLSWSHSILFCLILATARKAKGQLGISVYTANPNTAKHPVKRSSRFELCTNGDGKKYFEAIMLPERPVKFVHAHDYLTWLDIPNWQGWQDWERVKLLLAWYTQEWITHGAVRTDRDSREANLEDLIASGLYELVPALKTPNPDHMTGLHHRCVYARSVHHSFYAKIKPFTVEELILARTVASCFLTNDEKRSENIEPPLFIFIDLLALKARPDKDPVFMEWIKSHYSAQQLQNIQYEHFTAIANNLPEQLQTLKLVKDAYRAFSLPALRPPLVWRADGDFNMSGQWKHEFPKKITIKDTEFKEKRKSKVAEQRRSNKRQKTMKTQQSDHTETQAVLEKIIDNEKAEKDNQNESVVETTEEGIEGDVNTGKPEEEEDDIGSKEQGDQENIGSEEDLDSEGNENEENNRQDEGDRDDDDDEEKTEAEAEEVARAVNTRNGTKQEDDRKTTPPGLNHPATEQKHQKALTFASGQLQSSLA